ncbi:MAG: DNA adenine methylase [Syntrophales bacterium]|nr:DNA adenine methylase [Syntrophales bacterium]
MHLFTPLRYPGGKGKLAPFLKQVFRYNNLCDGIYVEPYTGGAAVALTLLLQGYAWEVVINDIDPLVYSFWWSVLNDTESLSKKIHDTPVTMQVWREQKLVHAYAEQHSITDVGFATFFLNRTNRSGILQGGVIGGKNQDGPFKLDARFNKRDMLERIDLIARYKGRIRLFNKDAWELITELAPSLPQKCLLYFDPPYFNKGKFLYKNYYTPADHARMAVLIRSLPSPWVVTYDNVPEIRKLYTGEEQAAFDISYSAHQSRLRGSEIMFYRNLELPSVPYTRKSTSKNACQEKLLQ